MTIPAEYEAAIAGVCARQGIRPALLAALLEHESKWDPNAIGDGGAARGLGQMHEAAAAEIGVDWEQLLDPAIAIVASGLYLAKYLRKLGGDERLALMAYNQGPTVICRASLYADAVFALAAAS